MLLVCWFFFFFFSSSGDHRDLHVLTPSFPTRRSSDRIVAGPCAMRRKNIGKSECLGCLHANKPSAIDIPSATQQRSEEHTSELQSLMRISYAVFCLKKKH